ncbi:DUF1631 domain-containing protein [Xanthomonas translucens]|uniref:DUF1631 domain-containing protein n=9 Tax=Xanthomonas campestris pv. translucens TaxID=343 RepID=UPI00071E6E9E|nr:DUF1631 domain-containing protein [Xanthomonas translucens]KTF41430.1 thymidine phosphorylase [Xanthomonas translucens pv. translucens]MCS3361156.1 DUF1631 domain-containing protein [Xanthomonas translucens pv. translucens]MCS3374909.1 DUF1631 domain-containing protein [Xanthomonas translucens pv. translucens]MCT8275898.1 DUF1631 domain-containing protein [Xanthomonas translucens pv. translucens]MCT8279512.1 DUF1631 domain-containing protein [Xanthomonas translucens pv. translucens]
MSFSPSSPHAHPARDPHLLMQAREGMLPVLGQAFAAALAHFDDVLFDRAESAGASQLLFLDGMRELRRRRDEIAARFRAQLDQAWQALDAGTPLSAEVALAGYGQGLSLVSESELESRLAVRNLASVLLREWKPMLNRIDRRLGWIAGGLELDADTNPVGPEHIGVAVHAAFSTSDLAPEVRLVLIKLCERDLTAGIGRLYQELDDSLARAGVMPEISRPRPPPPPQRRAPAPEERQARGDAAGVGEDRGAAGETGEYDDHHAPAWASRFVDRWAQSRGHPQSAETGASQQGMVLEALHELLQQTRSARENAIAAASAAVGQQRSLSQREMISVLSLLQATPSATLRAAIGDDGESLAQRLKSEVLSNATQFGVDPTHARLDPVDEDAIDLVGMLFDVMLDERDLEGRSREMIERLVVPFVKVALLDRRMFVQKTHPARRLLNALAEACEGNTGESPAERVLMGKVEEIIERLVADFNENLAIFLTLEEEFRDFLAQHRRRIEIAERRAAETQRGQEKLELARQRAEAELQLRLRLQGAPLPQALEDFLRQPWQHHLTMAVLREGEDGAGVRDALALADGLLEEAAEARRHIVGKPWLQAWQGPLHKVFASVGLHAEAAAAAINALHDTLQAVAELRPELERPLPELPQVALPQPPLQEAQPVEVTAAETTEDYDNADADRFRAMPIGTWLDFIDRDGKVQTGKLSWVSPISARLLFVNRRGVRFCVVSPEELAVMVRLGRLRSHINDGAFDSAMQGVIDRLDPQNATLH